MSASPAQRRGNPKARTHSGATAGTTQLVRLILRRDRVWLPVWMAAVLGLVGSRATSYPVIYPDAAARRERYSDVMRDVPMFRLFQGPAYDDSLPALMAQETVAAVTLVAALGAAIFVARNTRGEEQAGRRELVGSAAVGRHAQITAALLVVLATGTMLGAASAAVLVGAGMPVAGSLAFGLVVVSAVGIAGILAAVTAQLTESSRVAGASAIALFTGMHFVRGAFDMGDGSFRWFGWLVPNGWLQRTRPYADEQWWPFLLVLVLMAALAWAACALSDRRDLGTGLMATRPGPARAAGSLSTSLGLAWRLHRTTVMVWAIATVAIALPTGLIGAEAMEDYADSERMREWATAMGGAEPSQAFFTYIAFLLGFPITMYAIMTVLRLRQEENSGHAELMLSASVARTRWVASHLAIALASSAGLQLILGLCFGLGSGDLGGMLTTTLSLVPALWVMVGITMAAFGLLHRGAAVVGWGALVVALAVEFGQHVGLPRWIFMTFSPYAHVLPFLGPPSPLTLGTLTVVAAVLIGIGLAGVRRRDMLV
ncbi:ABC-2 type transport system permease protein [Haloactinospora alba]|uniref:ABC-2 type transport system permease protein n=1 Tax=Haloactinospora alba TaxID=405555 RepID=A0A543NEJ2_9ACTN|nr:antibiotic ABC transporter [Haloactinospora alba]TQN30253.1 ABC-2 type transport system permease protein [Haloactinospora alba]